MRVPFAAALLVALGLAASLRAQSPTIERTIPQAVVPGQTAPLEIRGGNLADASGLWTSFPAEVELDGSVREAGRARFRVTVPADVPPGLHGLRVVSPGGLSAMRLFVVDDLPSVETAGDNDALERAQMLEPAVAVDGHVDGLKTRYFRFRAEAGQRLSFEVLARRIGSPLDPVIRLLDDAGHELVYSDDEPGLVGDARLRHEFSEPGEYVLELRDIRYAGGGGHHFRLRIGDFPCIDVPVPMAVQRGSAVDLRFAGPHVEVVEPRPLTAPTDPAVDWLPVAARFPGGAASGLAMLAVTDEPQTVEAEPNDDVDSATKVELGHGLNGLLGEPKDVDHYRFTAKKDETRRFEAITRRQGSAADLFLRLLDGTGKQLAVAEDNGTGDALLVQKFPADGEYVLAVEDLNRRGGPEYAYRIAVSPAAPPFALSAALDRVEIPATGVGAIAVNVARSGHDGEIELEATGVPEGITAEKVVIGAGRPSATITLRARDGALSGRYLPLRIVGRATVGGQPFETDATVLDAIRATNAGTPYPPPHLADALGAAVAPEPPFVLDLSAPTVTFGPQLSGKLTITARRRDGFDEAIALAVEPEKEGLPANVAAALQPIPKGATEVEISFNATDKAALGRFSAAIKGTIKQGEQTVAQFAPGIGLELRKPFSIAVETAGGMVKKGGELKLLVTLDRNPALQVPVELQIDNLPAGVSLKRVGVPTAANSVELVVAAAADAAPAEAKEVVVTGTAAIGETKLVATTAKFTIKVE